MKPWGEISRRGKILNKRACWFWQYEQGCWDVLCKRLDALADENEDRLVGPGGQLQHERPSIHKSTHLFLLSFFISSFQHATLPLRWVVHRCKPIVRQSFPTCALDCEAEAINSDTIDRATRLWAEVRSKSLHAGPGTYYIKDPSGFSLFSRLVGDR